MCVMCPPPLPEFNNANVKLCSKRQELDDGASLCVDFVLQVAMDDAICEVCLAVRAEERIYIYIYIYIL